ncbi:NAD(P)-binding protein [Rhodococcus ruber]|uniref:NAD(P)-binding protein n=1 Tax=Rhodococcus ruber TaxID=1830 RepID=UPI00111F3BD9|nr:NAD(P)-binding protein [Rhodococcus ruber]QDC14786.1 NAD(P)-binding protein [Rhodococcus ruber]
MPTHRLEADYLVIGCGAAGMAFADALITDSDTDVVMVDRRHAPGGHWNEAYPFVRLHQPSAYYGVNSLPLGTDVIDRTGPNRGMYEQASAPEICAYFDRVMRSNLLTSGAVRYFPLSEYVGDHRFVSRISTDRYEVEVRTALVDATYLEPAIPATFTPPFDVAPGVRCVPVDALARVAEPPERYVIIGAGKTAMDACLWLLQLGLPPDAIQWVKPREAWLRNRRFAQGGELVDDLIEGLARQMEAAARARTPAEKNRLCPLNRLPDVPLDWIRGMLVETNAEYAWSKEPDMADWLERSRLNTSRGLRHRADRPLVREATRRFATHVRPALANLTGLLDDARQAA